ncbi:MAG: hypothetical protein ABSE46_25460 [Terracidiphilus sp.]|jgi:hypothetical protein
MPSLIIHRTVSLEETAAELSRKLRSAFFNVTQWMARGTVFRTIIAFASSVFAAAFGGLALAAWETTLSLLAAKWSAQVETPATGEWKSDAAGANLRGPGCKQKGDEHPEHRIAKRGPCFRTVAHH